MVSPNSEQKLAIEHSGGVLLSAGAGSGKTFVLENHIIYLTQKWIDEYRPEVSVDDFSSYIKKKFKAVVVMTFTRKAAGELELRIQRAFESRAETNERWNQAFLEINALTVGTIHSFCLKLISQGFFPKIPAGQKILSTSEINFVVQRLFDNWLAENSGDELAELFYKNHKNLLLSLKTILGDPSLRLSWDEATANELSAARVDEIVRELFDEYDISNCHEGFHLGTHDEHAKKTWYKFLEEYLSVNEKFSPNTAGLLEAYDFFKTKDFKIPATPRGKTVSEEVISYWTRIKDLKDFCKENGEDFYKFFELKEARVLPWFNKIKEMVTHIETEYQKQDGFTFSDLEYYVLKGLQHKETRARVADQYKYFIVDEFQDTSYIQYQILKYLSENDHNRLFCVGDVKQAIYGFRGGELGVFLECSKNIRQNLSLKNNYRSSQSVIEFNNAFFESMFRMGRGFSGRDHHVVPFESQDVPETTTLKGSIKRVVALAPNSEEKLSNLELNYIEASATAEKIKSLPADEDVVVLYSRLKPSNILIRNLMGQNIGFSAQVKVPFGEDPVIGLFYVLLERALNRATETKDELALFLIQEYLGLLGCENILLDGNLLERFDLNRKYYGLKEAFEKFLGDLSLVNTNYNNNLVYIADLINLEISMESIFIRLSSESSEANSVEFKYGENPDRIKIMTAHASKGLEFDHVILGGIYTNDSNMPDQSLIGKIPSSFKWTETIHGKKRYKTPHLLLEELQTKNKEFSETKRLFYVANTRAVNSLSWIDIDFNDRKRDRSQSSCWQQGIEAVLSEVNYPVEMEQVDLNIQIDLSLLRNTPPMFHESGGGVLAKKESSHSMLLPELSVTKLSLVEICPRRFYLSNICKISEDELLLLEKNIIVDSQEVEDVHEYEHVLASSAERGTAIHELISQLIKGDYLPEEIKLKGRDLKSVEWAVEKVQELGENFDLYSEKQIKFEIFNYMVSGIPDLFCLDKNSESAQIWDFKTGKYSEDKLPPYWFQLFSYAQGLYRLNKVKTNSPIKLVLCFVDEQRIVEKTVFRSDVEKYLDISLAKTQTPWVTETDQCEYCPYKTICKQ